MLDTRFARYGYAPTKLITREAQGIRFRLPAATKGVGQTGWCSYFALAGDFEISATYDLVAVPPAQGGYGVTCGLAVDTEGPGGSLALARGLLPEQGSGYVVSRGLPTESGTRYATSHYPTQAKTGQLTLRREQAELVCLAADGARGPLVEICRLPFTDSTVRKVRIFADLGRSPTALDARMGNIRVRAGEITGGIPRQEASQGTGWWLVLGVLIIVAALALVIFRRQRQT